MAKRKYRIVAEEYLTEWLALNFPPGSWKTSVSLGDVQVPDYWTLTPEEKKFIKKPLRPVCDAVIFYEGVVQLVEAKIREERGKLEQLLLYDYLFPKTPEMEQHWDKPRKKILLTPKDQGNYAKFLEYYGIEIVYYAPPWIKEYLGSIDRRYRRGTGSSYKI